MLPLAQRRQLQERFEQAVRLLDRDRSSISAAAQILAECVAADPGNLIFLDNFLISVKLLRQTQSRTRRWLSVVAWPRRRAWRLLVASKNWPQVLSAGPNFLVASPSDLATFRALAEASSATRMPDAELRYLRAALELAPADGDLNSQAAWAFQRAGFFDDAAACWRAVLGSTGSHTDADKFLPLLTAAHDEAAVRQLFRSAAESGGDLQTREQLEALAVARQQRQLETAERLAALDSHPQSQGLVEQMRMEVNRQELDFFRRRSERYPTDLPLKLELGERLKRAGNYAEAIKCFEPLAANIELRARALLEMAECQQMLRRFPRALAAYQEAIALLPLLIGDAADKESAERAKRIRYQAAVLAISLGEPSLGQAWLREVCAVDSGYKDAQDRLDKLGPIRDKG